MTLRQLRVELDFAINMANLSRDTDWLPIIDKLDTEIKARTR